MSEDARPAFHVYIGVDYSGAATTISSLKGLRVYTADRESRPREVLPPLDLRKNWSRRGLAEWLIERLAEGRPTIVGIDHAFSFPLDYFEKYNLPHEWPAFLEDFQRHWPTDGDLASVQHVRDGSVGNGSARSGSTRWRRLTDRRSRAAKSVFHFDVQGSVAKSTHSGLPWLLRMRQRLGDRVHFWPFDGWGIPAGRSAVVEVYPRLWSKDFPAEGRTSDQHDAWSVAEWLRRADADGNLEAFLHPALTSSDRKAAEIEGWILGI